MSRLEKLLQRFKDVPSDFSWKELVKLMHGLGFDLDHSGGGSHCKFVHRETSLIVSAYRPHPDPTIPRFLVRQIKQRLEELGVLP